MIIEVFEEKATGDVKNENSFSDKRARRTCTSIFL